MNSQIREKFILNALYKHGQVSVKQIVDRFSISGMTARRDITKLEQKGYLLRIHGGAIKNEPLINLFSFSTRIERYKEKKNCDWEEGITVCPG